jgi:AbrB family looped-hinge helix DNA binding protein
MPELRGLVPAYEMPLTIPSRVVLLRPLEMPPGTPTKLSGSETKQPGTVKEHAEAAMTTTLTVDKAGRVVIPKTIRERMHLQEGSRLRLELVGDRLELSHEPDEVQLQRRGKRRVIVGWPGFDAAKAVQDAREEHLDRLAGKRREA